mmetsp:Transcript_12439/g.34924  ORF Transcript_12439/g.34924 Transcript_12439/m.34924 type:complete len:247 (+) Transcript_12439:3019-3759(+)
MVLPSRLVADRPSRGGGARAGGPPVPSRWPGADRPLGHWAWADRRAGAAPAGADRPAGAAPARADRPSGRWARAEGSPSFGDGADRPPQVVRAGADKLAGDGGAWAWRPAARGAAVGGQRSAARGAVEVVEAVEVVGVGAGWHPGVNLVVGEDVMAVLTMLVAQAGLGDCQWAAGSGGDLLPADMDASGRLFGAGACHAGFCWEGGRGGPQSRLHSVRGVAVGRGGRRSRPGSGRVAGGRPAISCW